jgi:hypothetical protein
MAVTVNAALLPSLLRVTPLIDLIFYISVTLTGSFPLLLCAMETKWKAANAINNAVILFMTG